MEKLLAAVREVDAARADPSQRAACKALDVTDGAMVQDVMMKAVAEFGAPDVLINCAGRAFPRRFEELSREQFEDTMRTNLYGAWSACAVLVPIMKARGGGAIVNVSSIAGLLGVYGYTDYSASKFALVGFSEALRQELRQHGVSVHVLCPPDTDTPGFEVENRTKPEETKEISKGAKVMRPDDVARTMLKGLEKGKFIIIPGLDGRLTVLAKRLFPSLVDFFIRRSIARVQSRGVGDSK
jgi:short-subunit dehydrogenase